MLLWYVYACITALAATAHVAMSFPAFVAAPLDLAGEEYWKILNRQTRNVYSGGSGYYTSGSGDTLTDDEDYGNMKPSRAPRKPEIRHFFVDVSITARFANTLVTSKLTNIEGFAQEAVFSVILPEEAFIYKFLMVIEGVTYEAEVKEKVQAQREYDAAKERGQTAGQVKQHATKPNTFSVSVNIAAYTSVNFNLTYQELLQRRHGNIEYKLNVDPGQLIGRMEVDIHITEPQGLHELSAMWLSTGTGSTSLNEVTESPLQQLIHVDKLSQNRAHVKFHPSKDEQKIENANGIDGTLLVQYDVLHELSAGNLQVMNGYFVHYFSPEGLQPAHKDVVFVIDVSGSMYGSKMSQTIEAMQTILADIREGDRLNIVTFTDYVNIWKSETMVDRTDENIEDALNYVGGLQALAGTNLNEGLMAGVALLNRAAEADSQSQRDAFSMIIVLTDGRPSTGVTNPNRIRDNVLAAIEGRFSLFCLGFGRDLDHYFMEKMAAENQGVARKIYTDSSAPLQLKGFYDEVATPLLFNIGIEYNNNVVSESATTQTSFISYFQGTELVVAGRLNTINPSSVPVELVATVSANSMDSLIELQTSVDTKTSTTAVLSRHTVDNFCQRLWAYMTIKSLLKSKMIARTSEERDALKARALKLSLEYSFVTPLTSLLVVRPEEEEKEENIKLLIDPEDNNGDVGEEEADDDVVPMSSSSSSSSSSSGTAAKRKPQAPSGTGALSNSGGRGGGGGGGGFADSDPHFVVHVPRSDVTVCFDILGQEGEVYNLLSDDETGIRVLGLIVAAQRPVPGTDRIRTYFGRIGVQLPGGYTVRMTTKEILVGGAMSLTWGNTVAIYRGNWSVIVRDKRVLITTKDGKIGLSFMMHRMNPNNEYKIDHLGFYVVNYQGLSKAVHGLIGQFQQRKIHVTTAGSHGAPIAEGALGELNVADRKVSVFQRSRLNSLIGQKQPCWFAARNAEGLIDGQHTDYLVAIETMP